MSAIADVLAINLMMERLYASILEESARSERFADNQLWQIFMNPAPRKLYRDYETVARHLVAVIRFNAVSHQDDP